MYKINEETARRANDMNSMSDYQTGSATAEYSAMVREATEIADRQKQRVDPMYHEKIDYLLDLYCRKLAENLNSRNQIDTRCPSWLICGGGNFPTRKKEQQNAARDRNFEDFNYVQELLTKIKGTGTAGISGTDPDAVEKLKAKLAKMQEYHEAIKRTPNHPAYMLANSSANMRRVKQRIAELETRPEYEGWNFAGGHVEVNDGRVQIFTDEKPADTQIYKDHAFKWSPRNRAWQRQATPNGMRAAHEVTSRL